MLTLKIRTCDPTALGDTSFGALKNGGAAEVLGGGQKSDWPSNTFQEYDPVKAGFSNPSDGALDR